MDNINEFINDGVTVFENVISDDTIKKLRNSLHNELLLNGINHDKILSGEEVITDGHRIKGKTANFYYGKWKIDAQLDTKIYEIFRELNNHTFSSGTLLHFEHPFGPSNDVLPFIDRICWRLPDKIRAEGGLGLHIDRNPYKPYDNLTKWRPIQAFLCLTDHFDSESGGLKVVKGFHKRTDEYFHDNVNIEGGGEFYRMNSKAHEAVKKELQPIYAPAGSLVCWDNRLPHATCDFLNGDDTREVIYMTFIPNVKLNMEYHKKQLLHLSKNIYPPYYCDDPSIKCNRDWDFPKDLNEEQRKILKI